jgi:hypothetical protein
MRSYLYPLLLVIFSSMILANCDCKHVCNNHTPELNFVNFDSTDLHTVIIKSFLNNGSFDHLLETKVYSNVPAPQFDTMPFVNNRIYLAGLVDYIIEIPAVNRTYTIKKLQIINERSNVSGCTGGMSWMMNDSFYSIRPTSMPNSPGLIDITK